MQLVKVSKDIKEYKAIKSLYKQAFPIDERAPFWLLMRKANQSVADFWALYDEKDWIGIAYVVRYKQLAYIFYLAIAQKKRSKGYGEKVMNTLKDYYNGNRLFLALEALDETANNYEQRVKRHSFYKKCGLSDLPYKIKEASVIYDIMGTGGTVEPEEYQEMIENYLGKFFSKVIDMRIIK